MISRGLQSSLQRELDNFSKELMGGDFNIRNVTKGALSQARAKLKPEAFKELNRDVVSRFYDGAPYQVWHGHRLLAVDGSRLLLPKHESTIKEFGEHSLGPYPERKSCMAMASLLYDPVNLITLDAQIAPYASSERDLLYKHLEYVKEGDLILLDRGYAGIALFFLLMARKTAFCVRIKEDWWFAARELKESGLKEMEVEFDLPKKDQQLLKDYPWMKEKKIKCRLLSIDLENGEKEILCTSLLDTAKYLHEDLKELYQYRWGIEEAYKLFKSRMEVESFSGKTAIAVKQDFYAKVYMMSLCASLAFPIEERVRKENKDSNRKHERKINRTSAQATLRDILINTFLKNNYQKALMAFDNIVSKTTEIIRKGRSFIRKHKPKKRFYMNYKKL